jgi:cysteine dioxygenase
MEPTDNLTSLTELFNLVKYDFNNSKKYLSLYTGNDYKNFVKESDLCYQRQKIYTDNNVDMFIITWNKNQLTPIHNHADNGCFLKVLDGCLKESIYDKDLNINKESILYKNDISFMSNNIGLHTIDNISDNISVSLHLYSPSNFVTKFYT